MTIKLKSILTLVLLITIFSACTKQEVVQDVNTLGVGSYVKLVKSNNLSIDATNASSSVSIDVQQYGSPQEKLVLYVSKGARTLDRTKWRKIKDVPNTGNVYNLTVTISELRAAFTGSAIEPGDQYQIYNQCVTKDGRIFDIANTGTDFASLPGYSMAMSWTAVVVCPFIPSAATGTYRITEDPFDGPYGSIGATARVVATANSAVVTYLYPMADNPGLAPVTLTINPQTGSVTISRQTYGSYGGSYNNMQVEGSGFFFSCKGTINLTTTHRFASGSIEGQYPIALVKQ
jgi:hypothetical protein